MYNLNFISEEDLTNHVQKTIKKYGDNLNSYNLKKFNKNIVDPIKLIFDKNIYNTTWEGIIESEILGRGISQIIMQSDISTKIYSHILTIVLFQRRMGCHF